LNRRLARGHALPRVLKGLGIVSIVGEIVLGVPLTLFGLTVAGSVGAHVVFGLLFAGIPVGLGLILLVAAGVARDSIAGRVERKHQDFNTRWLP
jgi:hypothetical protein